MSDTIDQNLVAFPLHGHLTNQLVTEMYMSKELLLFLLILYRFPKKSLILEVLGKLKTISKSYK